MDPAPRVAITGLGAWTPFGAGWAALRSGLAAGRSALTLVGDRAPALPEAVAGLIRDLAPFRAAFPEVRPPLPIAPTQIALFAAHEALTDAGLAHDPQREQIGVYLGRNRGPAGVVAKIMDAVLSGGAKKTSPLLFSQSVANAPLGAIAAHLVLRGPNLMTQGGGALLLALDALRRGDAPALLVGGFEEIEAHCFAADAANGFIRPRCPADAIRPYDPTSAGPTFGEGAVFLALEPLDRARARGATIYAELCAAESGLGAPLAGPSALAGWGSPTAEALLSLIQAALRGAHLTPSRLDHHSGGGNGDPHLDALERRALALLGRPELPSTSPKGQIGDGLGFGAVLAAALAADAPSPGREEPRPSSPTSSSTAPSSPPSSAAPNLPERP
jgi:3-oxoacyl-[acyl-carrier-protein] synthase II